MLYQILSEVTDIFPRINQYKLVVRNDKFHQLLVERPLMNEEICSLPVLGLLFQIIMDYNLLV